MHDLQNKPFALLGVNLSGCDSKTLRAVMSKEDLGWRSFVATAAIRRTWNSPGTPTFYLVDHRGVIRRKWLGRTGAQALDAAIAECLVACAQDQSK